MTYQSHNSLHTQDRIQKQNPAAHNAAECFTKAIHAHQAGQWQAAETHYKELLNYNPKHLDALTLLGTLYSQLGHYEDAAKLLTESLTINPNQANTLNNLGNALRALNRRDEALASYNLAVTVNPDYADAYCNRAIQLKDLNQLDAALADCDRAIALKPDYAAAYCNRANILHDLQRYDEALINADKAISLVPNYVEAFNIRGNILLAQKQYPAALASYDHAIALKPDYVDAYNNRANTLRALKRYDEMLEAYTLAIKLNPNFIDAYFNRGIVLDQLGRFDEALEDYDKAIAIDPNRAILHWNKAQIKLLKGDWLEGWPLYEWRWKYAASILVDPYPSEKRWSKSIPLNGKTILLHTEQGLGDSIQFSRYIPLIASQGANVVLKTSIALKDLLSTLPCKFTLVTENDPLPSYDYHYPLMSLPLAFDTTPETVPNNVPYLSADTEKRKQWQAQLSEFTKPKIGLIWNGSSINPNDHNRSASLENIANLLEQNYSFHCLQKNIRLQDQNILHKFPQLHIYNLNDLTDTAALIQELDLIISVCTSVGHLAGALGKPLWVMLTAHADWRWLQHRQDSPWYPSARLFRQTNTGNWEDVIGQIIKALETEFPHKTNE